MNNTYFGYTGEVIIKYRKNGKLIEFRNHNDGKEALFQTLATLLARQEYPHGKISYIALKNGSGENLLNSAYIPITQLPQAIKLEDDRWACSVNTTISSYDRSNVTPSADEAGNVPTNILTLLSSNGSELATVAISEASILSITQGVQLFIQWNLIVDN